MFEPFDAGTLDAVTAGIGQDLASSVGSDHFQVDLQALHDYYDKVYEVWVGLNHYASTLPADPFAGACILTSQIPGVAQAIQATVESALGTSDSMRTALMSVRANLSRHLNALATVYTEYVNVDHQNATELTQAGSPAAAEVAMTVASS